MWLDNRLIDVVCPMAYTPDASIFAMQIASVRQLAGEAPVWAGIGAYRLTPSAAVENIRIARELGAEGVILFSYDNLDNRYVATVNKGAFAK